MGVFDDKKFEKLDWMTQITETIESELNELLARLPNRTEFDIKDVLRWAGSSSFSIRVDSIVRDWFLRDVPTRMSYDEQNKIVSCFKFEISQDLSVDFERGVMEGTLALVKIVPTLTDEELQPLMGARGIEAISNLNSDDKDSLGRLNEMLDVLGKSEEAQRTRSHKKKMVRVRERLKEIFADNEWRIRDMALANKIGFWIADYVNTGNLAALTNFCKIKVMTHNNMPIYSVEEEK